MPYITVFTPTFNRIDTLKELYKSLLRQSSYNFEWLVIDDGSSDNTEDYFREISRNESKFKVRYYKVKNGGKHRAINKALDCAEGDYFFIVDSDDYLTERCIEIVENWIRETSDENNNLVGVSGLKGFDESKMVGKTFEGDFVVCNALERYKYNIYGDKSEVYKTSILKQYKFPEIEGENFITESIVWNRIAKDGYKLKYYNQIIYICEYRQDGLTKRIDEYFCKNFKGYTLYVRELLGYDIARRIKIRAIMAYGYRGRMNCASYKTLSFNIGVPYPIIVFLTWIGSALLNITKLFKRMREYA